MTKRQAKASSELVVRSPRDTGPVRPVDGGELVAVAGGPLKGAGPTGLGVTHDIQTTMQPSKTITVDDVEYQQLLAQHLVYSGNPVAPAADSNDLLFADKVTNGPATGAALRAALGAVFARKVRGSALVGGLTTPGVIPVDASVATVGTSATTTTLSSGYMQSTVELSAVTVLGTALVAASTFPFAVNSASVYPAGSSPGPWSAETDLDIAGTTCELVYLGTGQSIRIVVDGKALTTGATITAPGDGNVYYHPITFATGGVHRLHIIADAQFQLQGFQLAALTDKATAPARRALRCMVLGDSYTEPTVLDTTSGVFQGDGWVQRLADLTGWDCWSVGSGGTGYINPAPNGSGRKKFLDRIAQDVLAYNPDIVIVAGGLNDAPPYSDVKAAAAAVFAALASVPVVLALSPFCPIESTNNIGGLLTVARAIRDAATAAGVPYLDLVTPRAIGPAPSTLSRALSVGADHLYTVAQIRDGNPASRVLIGNAALGHSEEVIELLGGANVTGNGDYDYYLGGTIVTRFTHGVGEPVVPVGFSYETGNGRQGATTGNGTADIDIGSDGTHPTRVGHQRIARVVARQISTVLPV